MRMQTVSFSIAAAVLFLSATQALAQYANPLAPKNEVYLYILDGYDPPEYFYGPLPPGLYPTPRRGSPEGDTMSRAWKMVHKIHSQY